jgi:DNA-binding NtrC family response regulator/tetratricopeptide (TPR) repeat protein
MEPLADLLGDSPGIRGVRETIRRLLGRQASGGRLPPILIQGETGTGKGLLARSLHAAGPRRDGPFVDLNCAAIPDTLLEAELFGYERGAFTDARQAKPGLFQAAHRGTLFLDEIGLLPEGLQGKLLTVIEERVVRRLGSTRPETVDVWILTASNEDLPALLRQGRFREDLYHRLAVLTVAMPPLRERGEDVVRLAEHFLSRACADYGLPQKILGPDARGALAAYAWPGNVRELANTMERAALLAEGSLLSADALGLPQSAPAAPPAAGEAPADDEDPVSRLERERDALVAALRATEWNISRAATRLGIPRNTLRYRISKHRLHPEASAPASRPARASAPDKPDTTAGAVAAPPAPAPSALRWERRRLTLLHAALAGPAGGAEPGPEASRALEVIVEKVQSFGGRAEELSASGIVAVFGLESIEDHARRAAHAAMAIQRIAERARRANPERPAVRLALHTESLPVVQRPGAIEMDAEARHRAWEVLGALTRDAEPGSIRVGATTAPFLARRFELTREPAASERAAAAYQLVGLERPEGGRRLATFVGRRDELALLRNCVAATRRGHGQVVGIGGEAGIGKSRLLLELRQSLAGEPVTYLEGHCASYATGTPYAPLIQMLRESCRIAESDTPQAIVTKVRAGVRGAGLDPQLAAPYLLHLLGVTEGTEALAELSPEAIQTRMFLVMRQMSLEGSRRRPLVMALEDLHWIDKASEAYVESLVDSLAGAPLLVVLTYRSGYRPGWLTKSYATQIALSPLAADESAALLRSAFSVPTLSDEALRQIVERAEGNPFFLEELARSVEEHGVPPSPEAVPETIEEVVLARIDRLGDTPRRCLQTAAVLGREAPAHLLREVWGESPDLEPALRELVRLEFLFERPGPDGPVYVFTHALTREVARESLPPARRVALHAAAAQTLETLAADRLDTVADRLAYHYAKAKVADRAVEWLARVAEKSARSHAHVEAVAALREALEHADRLPADRREPRRLDLVLRLAHCLSFLGRFPETQDLLRSIQPEIERDPSQALTAPFYLWLAHTESHLGQYAPATDHALQALEHATRDGDIATMGRAGVVLAQEHHWAGQPLLGIARGRRAAELLEAADERWWLGLAHWVVGINYIAIGALDLAREAEARAFEVGEALGDARIQGYATWSSGWTYALAGDGPAAIEACRRGLILAPDPLNIAVTLGHLGYAHLEHGNATAASEALEDALARIDAFGFRQLEGRFTTFLGEARLLQGRLDEARELVTRGLRLSAESRYWYGIAWAQLALGRIALAAGRLDDAGAPLEEALETFSRIHARLLVGRTRLELARLAQARQDPAGALPHLREAHALFRVLKVEAWLARTAGLARQWGLALEEESLHPALAVVRRGEAELFEMLQGHLTALNLGQVIWDRRVGDRRREPAISTRERRRHERRRARPATWDTLGFLVSP